MATAVDGVGCHAVVAAAVGTVVVLGTIVCVVVVFVVENTVQFSGPMSATVKSKMCNNTFLTLRCRSIYAGNI